MNSNKSTVILASCCLAAIRTVGREWNDRIARSIHLDGGTDPAEHLIRLEILLQTK